MKYLTVPALGTGTQDDPYVADLPDNVSSVGQYNEETNTFDVIVTGDIVLEEDQLDVQSISLRLEGFTISR